MRSRIDETGLRGAVHDLEHRRALRGVLLRLGEAAHVGAELVGDREAGGVVARAVDAEAARQLLDAALRRLVVDAHVAERAVGGGVGLDTHGVGP
jgi:hypothetical protein